MRKLKLYLETSVWNFVFADDAPEKRDVTKEFFASLGLGLYEIFISAVVLREINDAPEPKRSDLFNLISKYSPMELEITEEANELAQVYLDRGIIKEKKRDDAFHIAIATISELDVMVTWNCDHMANIHKSERFNAANLDLGYTKHLEIVTPLEVGKNED